MISESNAPRVSVIIAAYNYGRFLGDTLESVTAQTLQEWECVVVDDGSTDNTREVVESYCARDSRIRYIYQTNQRAGAARNNGMRNTTGECLQYLDADDLLQAQKLERQVEYLDAHPDVDIVYGAVRSFPENQPITSLTDSFGEEASWVPRLSGSGKQVLMELIKLPLLIHAPLLRRSVNGNTVWFDEKLRATEDWFFWVRCALAGRRFQYERIDGTLGFYRNHDTSACADRPLVDSETRRLRQELKAILDDPEARKLNQRLAADYEGDLAVKALAEGRTLNGMWQLLKAGMISPALSEKMKWLFCAAIAPFAPREGFENVIAAPAAASVRNILKGHARGTS